MDSWNMPTPPPIPGSQNDSLARTSKSLPANNDLNQEHKFQAKTTPDKNNENHWNEMFFHLFFIVFLLKRNMKQVEQKVHFLFYKQRNFSSKTN